MNNENNKENNNGVVVKYKVLINSITRVKAFALAASTLPFDVSACSGKYVVDAKSIMGLFSLDLSKEIEVVIYIGKYDRKYLSVFDEFRTSDYYSLRGVL